MAYVPKIINSGVYSQTDINEEFQKIKDALDELLSKQATQDNEMHQHLDMGGHRVLNLPEPTEPTDVVRVVDILDGPIFQKIIDALKDAGY